MIIKSMARKEASFKQIVAYVRREVSDETFALHHNFLAQTSSKVVAEFNENAKLLKKRKNGNVMYHEILSIKRADGVAVTTQKQALHDIAQRYIKARAPHNLVFGGLHDDKVDNLHMHLVISANPLGLERRHSLTKAQFRKITVELEQRVLSQYPELKQEVTINKTAAIKLTKAGAAVKARTGKRPKRDVLANELGTLFRFVRTRDELLTAMQDRELQFYTRGKAVGVVNTKTGRKHRLQTLQIMADYQDMAARLTGKSWQPGSIAKLLPETIEAKPQKTADLKTDAKENEMDLSMVLSGLGAVADTLSIGVDLQAMSTEGDQDQTVAEQNNKTSAQTRSDQTRSEQTKSAKVKSDAARPNSSKTDRQIIAEARKAEMVDLRKHRQNTKSKTLSRTR